MTQRDDSHRVDLRRFLTIDLTEVRNHFASELARFRATAKPAARWQLAVSLGIVVDGEVRALTPEEWAATCSAYKGVRAGVTGGFRAASNP